MRHIYIIYIPAVTKGYLMEVRGAQLLHSLGDQTPPLCDSWYMRFWKNWGIIHQKYELARR